MVKRILIVIVANLAFLTNAFAQQDLLLSQEIFSRININPAGTGNSNEIDAFLHGRFQWAGIDNSPKTIVMNVTDYEEKLKSGFGLSVSFDKFGVGHSNTVAKAVYSYQFDLSEKTILSLGMAAGAEWVYFNFADNIVEENIEYENQLFGQDKATKVRPAFDFGIELTQFNWTIGASVTHMLNSEAATQVTPRHLYIYGIGLIQLSQNLDLSPMLCYMHRHQSNVLDIGALAYYKRFLWGGAAWRPDVVEGVAQSTLSVMLGIERKYFRFGYSYDMGLGNIYKTLTNTHEFILSFHMDKKR